MPLSIAAIALIGWGVLGLPAAKAVLLGAVLAPTDPVLASDVQVGLPKSGEGILQLRHPVRRDAERPAGTGAKPDQRLFRYVMTVSGADSPYGSPFSPASLMPGSSNHFSMTPSLTTMA